MAAIAETLTGGRREGLAIETRLLAAAAAASRASTATALGSAILIIKRGSVVGPHRASPIDWASLESISLGRPSLARVTLSGLASVSGAVGEAVAVFFGPGQGH